MAASTRSASPHGPFAGALADRLERTCLALDEAGALARSLTAEVDVAIVVIEVIDPTADCARSVVNVGGRVEVTLRGPAG